MKNRSCSLIDRQVSRLTSVSASQLQVFYCASNRGNGDDAAGVSAVKHAAVYFANRSSLYFTSLLFLPSLPSLPSLFLSFFNFLMGPLLSSPRSPPFFSPLPSSLSLYVNEGQPAFNTVRWWLQAALPQAHTHAHTHTPPPPYYLCGLVLTLTLTLQRDDRIRRIHSCECVTVCS